MSHDRNLSDRDIEKLLQGNDVDPALLEVAEWAAAVRLAADATVDSSMATQHVVAATQAAAARAPVGQALGTVRARSSLMLTKFYRSFAARVAAVATALVLATTGIAAAGVLPDGVQEPVADLYGIVGFDFHPDDDDGAGEVDDDDTDGAHEEDEDAQPGVEVGDGDEDDLDDDGEDEDEADHDDEANDADDEANEADHDDEANDADDDEDDDEDDDDHAEDDDHDVDEDDDDHAEDDDDEDD